MTKTAFDERKLEQEARIEGAKRVEQRKDREQKEAASKRSAASGVVGSAVKGAVSLLSKINDPKLYKSYVANIDKFTNWPTVNNPNAPFARNEGNRYAFAYSDFAVLFNGIYTVSFADTVGPQQGIASAKYPINASLSKLASTISANTGRDFDWDPGDLGLYLYSGCLLISWVERLKVAYAIASTYDGNNTYYGDALLAAMRFDPVDFRAHKADYQMLIEDVAARINASVVMPKDLPLLQRKLHMYTLILKDSDSPQSVIYVFNPDTRRMLNSTNSILSITSKGAQEIKLTFAIMEEYLNEFISRMADDASWKKMISDLRNAFKPESQYVISSIANNVKFEFTDDPYAKQMLRNLVSMPYMDLLSGGHGGTPLDGGQPFDAIVSNTQGYLHQTDGLWNASALETNEGDHYRMSFGDGQATSEATARTYGDQILRKAGLGNGPFYFDVPKDCNGDDILELTRLFSTFSTTTPRSYGGGVYYPVLTVNELGTEVAVGLEFKLLYNHSANHEFGLEVPFGTLTVYNDYSQPYAKRIIRVLGLKPKYAPNVILYDTAGNMGEGCYYGQSYNVIEADLRQIHSIHDVCVKALVFIPDTAFKLKGK